MQPNTTNESFTLLNSSGWIYDEPNSIPYAMAWMTVANAEQGTVATTSINQQEHGSDPRIYPSTGFRKNQRSLNGPMIKGDDWAYQMMNYPDVTTNGTYDTKMGWGANFGILGGFDNLLTSEAGKPLENPIFLISNYTLSSLPIVYLNNQTATSDSDYFGTLDPVKKEMWLTVNLEVFSPLNLKLP